VIHFAAESHVDNSIENPGIFVETNVAGTYTLLDVAYQNWRAKADSGTSATGNRDVSERRFHHISTDEVFGSLGKEGLFTETSPYAPNSPYSASKASSDMIVRSYNKTYGMNTVITHCSNNYGPKQHREKLIPTIIRNAIAGEPIPIYGDGQHVRDWLWVEDHCRAVGLVFHKGRAGETYNIGARNERINLEVARIVCERLDEICPLAMNEKIASEKRLGLSSYKELIVSVEDRAGHDRRYGIDAGKIERELGWRADVEFEVGVRETVEWVLKQGDRVG